MCPSTHQISDWAVFSRKKVYGASTYAVITYPGISVAQMGPTQSCTVDYRLSFGMSGIVVGTPSQLQICDFGRCLQPK